MTDLFPVTIRLSQYEIELAAFAACIRQAENIKVKRRQTHGSGYDALWHRNVEGTIAEWVCAKYTNRHWLGVGEIKGHDFGQKGEARWSDPRPNRHLILHKNSPPAHYFFLVVGQYGTYTIHGWLRAFDGMKEHYWTDPGTGRPCYMVPISDLVKDHIPDDL